jgi:hypothetical protein
MEKLVKPGMVLAALFVSCLLCIGCGGGSSSSSGPYSSITNGNWSLTATSTVTPGLVLSIGGSLTQSGNVVSGTMLVSSSVLNCPSLPSVAIPFTGTFSGDTLTLTSANFNNQFVTVNAIGSGDSLTGTYSVAGGCADGDNGTIAASYLPPLTGTWTGTITNPDGTPVSVDPSNPNEYATASLTLTQSATATNGSFPLSGAFNTNFAPGSVVCASGTIPDAGTTIGAYVMGTSVVISAGATNGEEILYEGLLDEVPLGSANETLIEGRLNLCGPNVLLNLAQQR